MTTKRKSSAKSFLEGLADTPFTFGEFLLAIREGEGATQVEFAGQLGVSRSHLCDIEKGRKTVSPERAAKFAHILGYSESQFVRLALQDLVNEAGLSMEVQVDPV